MNRLSLRRGIPAIAAALATSVALAACGSEDTETKTAAATTAAATTAAAATTTAAATAYPLTVETAYGPITLKEKPKRIVALTGQYADMLAGLGEKPVAFAGEGEDLSPTPWLEGQDLGTFDPHLVNGEFQAALERIAKYQPDLILANTYQAPEGLYEKLSQIAPTYVGASKGNNDWDVTFAALGQMTDGAAAMDAANAEVDAAYAKVREQFPQLEGKTYNSVRYDGTQFNYGNGSWMDGLGLKPATHQENSQAPGAKGVSLENLDQLDGDVLGIFALKGRKAIEQDPRFARLPSSTDGTAFFVDLPLAIAANTPGPLSLVWAMDKMGPIFADSPLGAQ
jgi:iron complex transport system substrate-binding protein